MIAGSGKWRRSHALPGARVLNRRLAPCLLAQRLGGVRRPIGIAQKFPRHENQIRFSAAHDVVRLFGSLINQRRQWRCRLRGEFFRRRAPGNLGQPEFSRRAQPRRNCNRSNPRLRLSVDARVPRFVRCPNRRAPNRNRIAAPSGEVCRASTARTARVVSIANRMRFSKLPP